MKRKLASIAGIVGIAALGRMLSRRRPGHQPEPHDEAEEPLDDGTAEADTGDPAEELRLALASQRQPGETTEGTAPEAAESLEERRARVHAKAREAIDAMSEDEAAE